jgi:hypothetical protein
VAENAATSTVIYTAVATDVDAGQTRTYSLSGTDAALLDINSTSGAVSLKASANFETKASYSFNVIATDNGTGSLTATQAVTVNVTDVNENPVITSGTSATAIEKLPATTLIYQTAATDVDAGQSQTYSISGGADQAKFQINSTTGALTFVNSPKFNQPVDADGNNVYQLEISASDGQGGTDVRQLAVTVVSDIDGDGLPDTNDDDIDNDGKLNSIEDPVLNALGTGTGDGNGDGIQDRSQLNVVSLPTIATSGGTARYATLVVPEQYTLSNVSNSAAPSTMGRSIRPAIGQFDFSVGGVTPGGSVTLSLYVEKSLNMNSFYKQDASGKWVNIATGVSTVGSKTKIDFSITDGGIFDADRTVNGVIVDPGVPAQMLPLIQSNGGDVTAVLNVKENQTAVTTVSASAFGNVVYSISGGADRSRFQIDQQTGVLTFVAPENFEAAADAGADNRYEVLVSATDANGTDTQSVTVVLQNVNESPTGNLKVSGRPEVGTTLTVEDTLVDPDGARQDAVFTWRDSDGNILGTGTSLLLKQAQVGKQINVTLTYRDPSGETETHRAQLSDIVIALPVSQPQTTEPAAPPPSAPLVSPVIQPSGQVVVDSGSAFLPPNSPLNGGTQPGQQSSLVSNPGAPNPVPNTPSSLPTSSGQGGPGVNDAPIFTRSNEGGFQVQVVPSTTGTGGLSLALPPSDLAIEAGGRLQIQLPSQTFTHTNPNASVQLFASKSDGSALPSWIRFNPSTGQFDMTPPPGFRGVVEVRIVARDQIGKQAQTTMKIAVGADAPRTVEPASRPGADARDVIQVEPIKLGRANLSDQLKVASRPLGSSERLVALTKAVQVVNQRRV